MGVYEDMANDAGYPFDTDENATMAQILEAQEEAEMFRQQEERQYNEKHWRDTADAFDGGKDAPNA